MEKIKKFLRNDFTVLILRLLPLYLVLLLTQIVFFWHNKSLLGALDVHSLPLMLVGALRFDTVSILYLNTLFIALSLLPFRFRAKNWYQTMLKWIYLITNTIGLIALNVADIFYYRYAFKRITMEEMHFFEENDNTMSIMLKSMGEDWYLVLFALALIALLYFLYKSVKYHPTELKKPALYYSVSTVLLGVSLLFWIFGIRSSLDRKARPITLSTAAYFVNSTTHVPVILSNPFCLFRVASVHEDDYIRYFEEEERESLFTPFHYPDSTYKAVFDGKKNVVLFVLESFSREHSQYLAPELNPDGGYTPFLDSLMQEGMVFTHAFANGMKSIEALPSIMASIPSYKTPFPLMAGSMNEIEGLPSILKQNGYSTNFFCGARTNQMGFEAFCKQAGVEHFYNRDDFEKVNHAPNMANIWGVWDMPFLQFMAHKLNEIDTPFFASVFTLTSHHPYDLPAEYAGKMPAGKTPQQPCVAYTDLSLRKFFETASKMPWFENTVFVFVADHVSPQIAADATRTPRGRTSILYFMFTPDHSLQGRYDHVTQQLDIMPTLLGLLGYQKPFFAFGRDVFNELDRYPMVANCVEQTYQCITDSFSLYFNGQKSLFAYPAQDVFQTKNMLNLSDKQQKEAEKHLKAILQTYYGQLKKGELKIKN